MKHKHITRFVKKMATRVIIFVFVMIVLSSIAYSFAPVISNEIALGQMENSNDAFVMMNMYNTVQPISTLVYTIVIIWFTYTFVRDIYKFVKSINTENEKEN